MSPIRVLAQNSMRLPIALSFHGTTENVIRPDTIKAYNAATSGWNQATGKLVALATTTSAQVRIKVSSLNATIYMGDFSFGP